MRAVQFKYISESTDCKTITVNFKYIGRVLIAKLLQSISNTLGEY
jgi:hypothetical protein